MGVATNAPATLTADAILKIYSGTYTTWGQVPGYSGPGAAETIIPLTLPTDAGMWNTFVTNVQNQNPGVTINNGTLRGNPQRHPGPAERPHRDHLAARGSARQRDRAVPARPLRDAQQRLLHADQGVLGNAGRAGDQPLQHRRRAPHSRQRRGDPAPRRQQPGERRPSRPRRTAATSPTTPSFRETDLTSPTAWQPGSTLNWVKALFYNPDGPLPFVRTPAGDRAPGGGRCDSGLPRSSAPTTRRSSRRPEPTLSRPVSPLSQETKT